jgi:AcrR family transcriptional regulator
MPRAFSEREKASIRASLINAGRDRLIRVGMHKTGVEDLTRAAHISKGAFYQFFPTKEALFITLFAEGERDYRGQLREFAARPGPTPSARLLAFFRNALRCYRDTPLLSKLSREDMSALIRALTPDGMRAATSDEETFVTELFEIWRLDGIKIKCTPAQLSALMQLIMVTDLYVHDLGETNAFAVNFMLEALADKLTK